jgi:aryl-alcohol dehydrogenase-like predicted oxidoreductase
VQGSLHRLGRASVYGLLLHRAPDLTGPDGPALVRVLQALKGDGLVRKIGVSVYAPAELDAVVPVCQPDLVQAPFNLVNRRLASSGWLDQLHGEGVEVHVRSAFLQGLLLMPRAGIPPKFHRWSALWGRWHAWQAEHDISAVQACLAFPLSFKQIDRAVVGVDTAAQLEQLIKAEAKASAMPRAGLPDLACDDEQLINPSLWNSLEIDA